VSESSYLEIDRIQRRVRVISILDAAELAGLSPLPLLPFHNIAYFADALAPVWGLRILDAQLLKRREGPISPVFQREVDLLVGKGVVKPWAVEHELDADGQWRLQAKYSLNRAMADRILEAIASFEQTSQNLHFVRELVQAMSALGPVGIEGSAESDASYGNEMVDFGSLVDIGGTSGKANRTAQVALRFGTLLQSDFKLTSAEMVHFYVRELYKRMSRAA
jgi:hypothetical protein